jgi:tetratricopeptide (TPR) repeat protein
MALEEFAYQLGFDDFDRRLLPADARTPGTDSFRAAVTSYLEGQYRDFGGRVHIGVDDARRLIDVRWSPDPAGPDPEEVALDRLNRRQYAAAIPLLEVLRRHQPGEAKHPYNLGMAYSDLGQFERARSLLRESLKIDPTNANALVALGVAEVRAGDTAAAIAALTEAVRRDPDNPWARRNLGGCLAKEGRAAEAEPHLRRAVELAPDDPQAVFGLAQVLEAVGQPAEADGLYVRLIDQDLTGRIGEMAKDARRRLAQQSFRAPTGPAPRPDAVMYLLGALERFEKMTPAQVQQVGFEIAVMGMKGLDTNDPAQKYRLKTLAGSYSGLHLVCLMFVAFRQVAPQHSIGFDLAREYAEAERMYQARKQDK